MRPLMPPVQTPDNLFHDGNPLTGELGTIVDAEHLNNEQAAIRDTQSELIAILTAAAMEPESTAGQLLAALNKLYAPLNDTLGALSTLVGGANKLPYFTAANAAALTALSSIGRDIIGKATVAEVLTYLQLGEAAKRDVGTTVGTVAAGDDLRITGALQKANNLYELTNKSDARANLGLGTVATKNVGNSAGQIPDMSYWSSPSGGINFPNGFQMRFGTIAVGGGKVFSTPFTNQCYGIVFGQTYASNYWIFSPMYRASDLSKTGFAFINTAWSGVPGIASQDAGESVFYLAVGF
ncbi:hypothetical protein [Citrobacter sedlakii]|uniref:hypothetical protein n=1 Tax=Citrobacter sedlakii TaxID=67826 RepID=UPI0020BF5200|nr:hypothetical protein [Citrobacter sedlakii]MCK8145663.1 hypothetical protein [Citrobacter sedlakii]